MRKKIFILLFLMLVLMSISAVSAADADNNNATIVSSADAGTLALANDINAIDNLNGNYSDGDTKAPSSDAKSVAVGKNEIYGATYEEAEGDSMSPVLGQGDYDIDISFGSRYDSMQTNFIAMIMGPDIPSGTLDLWIDNSYTDSFRVDNGMCRSEIHSLDAGDHTWSAEFTPDGSSEKSTESRSFTIDQDYAYVYIDDPRQSSIEMGVGESRNFRGHADGPESSEVNISSSNDNVAKFRASYSSSYGFEGYIDAVGAGTATITVSFAGNKNYRAAESKTLTVTVTAPPKTIYVNASANQGGNGSEAKPFQTLKEALDVAEDYDTIMIAAGTYTGKNNTGLTINHKLTFEKYGEGEAILDAENQWRIWYVNAGTININGLTFKNGKTEWDNGGAIYCNEPLSNSNINATFINNSAENYGGAIFFVGLTNVNITGIFTDNKVDYEDGGAIYFNWNNVEHVIISGEFKNNHAQNGGAIYFDGQLTDVNITGNFTDNIVDGGGGAIYCNEALSNSNIMASFINNTANSFGGAISFSNPTQLTNVNIYGEFINNTATVDSGGAIMFWNMVSDSIIDASFINNKAGDRGAAICFSSTLKNTDITGKFINNTGNSVIHIHAAGPYMSPSGYVYDVIHDSIFINNDASKIINIDSGEVLANDNWFGNNATNYDEAPDVGIDLKDWLFLNATADSTEIGIGENSKITFKLSSYNRNEVSNYNGPIDIKLDLNQTLGELDKTAASLGEEITYTAKNEGDASVTATFETASYTVDLINIKPKTPTSINLTNETMNLKVGDDTPAGATLDPANAGNLTYKSSDESVVTVENGVIKAVGEGTANVTVSFNGTDVYAPAERNISVSVSLNEAVWYYILQDRRRELDGALLSLPFGVYNCLVVNSTGQPLPKGLNVTIKLDDAYTINSTVGDDGIFEVDVNGITPKFYTATFSTYGYTSAVATVLIVKKPTSIALENETMALNVSDEVSAGATLNPAEAGNLTYKSSNESIVKVENNTIKALGEGTATITVSFAGDDEYAAAQNKIITVTVSLNDASVAAENMQLNVGENGTISYITDPDGLNVTFKPDDSGFISVDNDGTVTALKNGTAAITILVGDGKKYTFNSTTINVTVSLNDASVAAENMQLNVGENGTISYITDPDGLNVTFKPDDSGFISVDNDGTVTALKNGTAAITILVGDGKKYTFNSTTINVTVSLNDASVAAENMQLNVGENGTINYTTNPDGLNVTFKPDDSGFISVDNDGTVTALKNGTAAITILVGDGKKYTFNSTTINVTVSLNDASVAAENMQLNVGENGTINYTTNPDGLNVTFKPDDSGFISVDNDGTVTALKNGTAAITILVGDGKKYTFNSTTINVTVSLNDASVAAENMQLNVGENGTINYTTNPDGLNVTFEVDNSGVVSVDANGVVTALKEGTGNILIKVGGDGIYAENTTTVTVTVSKVPTEITISSPTGEMSAGAMGHVSAELNPSEAGNLTYTSNDTSVISVSTTGVIKANKAGTALITVSFAGNDKYAEAENKTITITVNLNNASVTVNNSTLDLFVDDNFTIVANTTPTGLNVTYVQDDSGVYTVDENGTVTALREGTGVIIVKIVGEGVYVENSTAVAVSVSKIPTEISVAAGSLDLKVLENFTAGATLTPADAGNLTYTSSNKTVAIVEDGIIKALGEGTTTITISFDGNDKYVAAENKTIEVTVSLNDASVTVNNSTLNLFVDDNFTIVSTTTPTGLNVTYVQDDSGVYTVDENGTVTALKEGTGNILIKVGGDGIYAENTTTVTVTVSKIPTEIIIANATLDVKVLNLTFSGATLNPSEAGNLTYNSTNSSIVMVISGVIIPVSQGNAIITVSFAGNDKYAEAENKTIAVTVSLNDASVTVENTTLDLKVGDTYTINATIVPEILKLFNVTYTSSDESVVTVDENGTVTAIGEGKAIITVGVGDDRIFAKNSTNITVTVNRIATEITASPVITVYNGGKYLIATLTDAEGNPLSGAQVTIDLNGAKNYTTDENGQVNVSTNGLKPVKIYPATITFAGDEKYLKSTARVNVGVKKATPRITSFNKVFKSTVTNKVYLVALKDNRGNAMKNTRVTLRVGGVTYSAITNAKGIAVFRLTKLTKVGLYNALARYAGNSYYNAVAKKTLVKVAFPTVSKGSKNKAMVKKIQIALKKNGYYLKNGPYTLPIDGIYNTQTVKAVMQFQKAKGLKVTGKVDQRTAKKLKII